MSDDRENVSGGIRLRSVNEGKIVVLEPENLSQSVIPLFCPLCEFPMITREDAHAYRKIKCCERCDMRWRSSKEFLEDDFVLIKQTREWKEYLEDRVKRSRQLIKLK